MGKTLFDKIWDSHVITDLGNGFVLLHIDRLLLHDLSGARALREVIDKGYTPAQPRLVYATPDHAISTQPGRTEETFPPGAPLLRGLRENTRKVRHPPVRHRPGRQRHRPCRRPRAGPDAARARRWCAATATPARTAAWASLAFGIGSSELEHVLATQTMVQRKPKRLRVHFEGKRARRA